jgi:serine protease Do
MEQFFGEDFFDRFRQFQVPDRNYEQRGLGTGVVVSSDGYILTNNHVIEDADEVTVALADDRKLDAKIVGTDDKTDIAVLKVNASGLLPAKLGDSDRIEVGEWVLAIGNPFELEQTVTAGIISGKGRSNMGITEYDNFIQTDAAINPGNSGGPLVNLNGEVIGINTAIASRTGGYMGVGFAIPINMARSIKDTIIKHGRVERGLLGASIANLDEDMAAYFGFEGTDGVIVNDLTRSDSPAGNAGVRPGDIIVEFDGKPMSEMNQLRNAVADTPPNKKTSLVVFRDGRRMRLNVTLGNLDSISQSNGAPPIRDDSHESESELGMSVQPLTPEIAEQVEAEPNTQGVVVTEVEPGGLANRAGIQTGDVILAINGAPVQSARSFREAAEKGDSERGILLQVMTRGLRHFVILKSRG